MTKATAGSGKKGVANNNPFLDLTASSQNATKGTISSSDVPFWGDNPAAWDTVILDGQVMPGICKVSGNLKRCHDKKKAPGQNGATMTYTGDDPADIRISFLLWTAEHLSAFRKVVAYLRDNAKATKVVGGSPAVKQKLATLATTTTTTTKREVVTESGIQLQNQQRTFTQFNDGTGFGGTNIAQLHDSLAKKNKPAVPGKTVTYSKPVSIIHPSVNLLKIKAVHVLDYGLLEATGDGNGSFKAEFRCVEAVPESIRNAGGVNTPTTTGRYDPATLGPGTIGRAVDGPSTTNTGP